MAESKKSGTILLTIVGLIWAGLGIVCFGLAFFFVAFYDSPIDPEAGMGMLDYAFIGSVFAFPIFCLLASLGIWLLKNRVKALAILFALIPLLPLSFIVFMFARPTSSFMKDTQDVQSASECASPVPDVGDGRETTRCGSLQVGVTVSGILSSTLEAHNWLFDSQTGPMEISIENDEKSCPHIMVLDTSGKIVDGFEDENDLRLCVSGLTTTGLYHFVPPASGIYIIRVYSPDSSGEYWLEIK